jgi:putative lipoic acid-binding regulatory protein
MNDLTNDTTLIEFPTAFPIKALGRDDPKFRQAIIDLVAAHAGFNEEVDVRVQASNKGNYISVTVTFTAESQVQLDTIYQSLHDHELVLMVF